MRQITLSSIIDIFGVVFLFGGLWLIWDLLNTIVNGHLLDFNGNFRDGWSFCYPAFSSCIDGFHWSHPFDIGMGMILVGAIMLRVSGHSFKNLFKMSSNIIKCGETVSLITVVVLAVLLLMTMLM